MVLMDWHQKTAVASRTENSTWTRHFQIIQFCPSSSDRTKKRGHPVVHTSLLRKGKNLPNMRLVEIPLLQGKLPQAPARPNRA